MSASTTSKKQCVSCNKNGGVLTCDGCQQSFCGKHVIEHRQELGRQLDDIMQEHDLLQAELDKPSLENNPLFRKIDEWEKDSIAKIQAAAEIARTTLEELLKQSDERLSKTCREVTENFRSSREADDYSENELIIWKKQLKQLHSEINSPSSAKLIENKDAPIYLLTIKTEDTCNNQSARNKNPPPKPNDSNVDLQERFLQTLGAVNIEESGFLANRVGVSSAFAYMRGRLLYSKGCYTIRFRIEQSLNRYRIFFGCVSAQVPLKETAFKSQHAVGWFGFDQVYEHGRCTTNCQKYGYHSNEIETNDILQLILDCDNKRIGLFHERKKTMCTLSVNDKLAPFPWQYLVVLGNPGDSVKILPNV